MKKIIHIALLCLTTIAFSQVKNISEKTTINTELSFGRLGLDCSGRGACGFNTSTTKAQANTQVTYNKENTITLIIDRSKITKEEEYKIVGQYLTTTSKVNELTFIMEEDLTLEAETKIGLKTAKPLTKIAKGNYPIIITKDTFTIRLKLE
ncbi:hypothetical protein Q4512_05510 [Oceanihabitans sp. 2_MG-2023]|uniref:hypothetical protein n=1 Tax=Oceanihabitans sp. 2_MG-2023 TaxID=3062661 RepID=UPI0026E1F3D0|nr:hypothetical protein [Oceanihabitans sp. 2_MG-2023]MDO6596362.1 hypothetical protein [Oceanihabitans sp. 2_MG-2023]